MSRTAAAPRLSRVRRGALRVGLYLFAGAIINVLVAWACAAWSPVRPVDGPVAFADSRPIPVHWNHPDLSLASEGLGVQRRLDYLIGDEAGFRKQEVDCAGWPMLCVWDSHEEDRPAKAAAAPRKWKPPSGLAPPDWLKGKKTLGVLPLRVDIAPFLVNSILFGSVLAVPGLVRWVGIRRAMRRARCLSCRYDLQGLTSDASGVVRCPECGEAAR